MNEMEFIHIACTVVTTYVVHILIKYSMGTVYTNKLYIYMSNIAYMLLSLLIYYTVRIPIIMMLYNLLFFGLITLNYKANIRKRILTVFYVYFILFVIEMFVATVTGYIHFSLNDVSEYANAFGEIANQLLSLLIARIIIGRKKNNSTYPVPRVYWISIIIVPIFSLCFLVSIFNSQQMSKIYLILSISFLLFINIYVMVSYDLIVDAMTEKAKGLLLEQQNKYFEQQIGLLQTTLKLNNRLQHDLTGHLLSIKSYLKESLIDDAIKYVDRMLNIEGTTTEELTSITGNMIIDSILNWKIREAQEKGVEVETKIQIPEELKVDNFYITIILGNILDNAIEASVKVDDESKRLIRIVFIYDRRRLILSVENTYNGAIEIEKQKLISLKNEKELHGIGLENVKAVIEKYDGIMDIEYDDKIFKINLLMYV